MSLKEGVVPRRLAGRRTGQGSRSGEVPGASNPTRPVSTSSPDRGIEVLWELREAERDES